jgi:c(7)-type cytochrome triheme protein
MKRLIVTGVVIAFLSISVGAGAQKIGGGDLTFAPKNALPVVFSHEKHVGKGLKCTGCHYQIFEMAKGSYKMDMAKITKGDFCGKCHNGQKAFDVKEQKNCIRCHR